MKTFNVVSLGCPKNLVDSEIMAASLLQNGYEMVQDENAAETVIVNTCGFIEESKTESIQKILELSELKKTGKLKNLVVAGCLAQRYKDDLVEGLPEADLFIGSGQFQQISEILKGKSEGKKQKTFFNLPTFLQEETTPRINSQLKHRAYLKISEGCLKRCAFCAIPLIRGNLQSRNLQNIVNEAKLLAAGGVKELLVISHDFTDFGWDLRKKNPAATEAPAELLRQLCKVDGIDWIRVLYLYPDGLTDDVLEVFATEEKMTPYFDMPLQHINNEMLKKMNRKMRREDIEVVLANIRKKIPNACIRTQFIVGFPGETQEQFEEVLNFMTEQEFDRVGCFKYSPEEGTAGGRMEQTVSEEDKDLRWNAVMQVAQKISQQKLRKLVGTTQKVLVEGFSEESELLLQGRLSTQAPDIDGVVLINAGVAKFGTYANVKIKKSMEYDLIGEIVG